MPIYISFTFFFSLLLYFLFSFFGSDIVSFAVDFLFVRSFMTLLMTFFFVIVFNLGPHSLFPLPCPFISTESIWWGCSLPLFFRQLYF